MTLRAILMLCVLLSPAWCLSAWSATILTFEPASFTDGGQLPADYGSRAIGTPNIALAWSTGTNESWCPWPTQYGDLINVAFGCAAGSNGPYSVTFTADSGWDVIVESFDVAGWPNRDRIITQIQVGTQTFNNVLAPGVGHNTLAPNELGSMVLLRVTGPDFFNGGMDNLQFSQVPAETDVIPEPGSLVLLGAGIAIMRMLRRSHLT